jgi:uncharacterized cupin superfamily protein
VPEARLEDSGSGVVPASDGWFVVNVRDTEWWTSVDDDGQPSGAWCAFESPDSRFRELGVGLHVLLPGEANGLYHRENAQEDFVVLAGECLLLVEGDERLLRAWDVVHCPPWTEHIFVGAGDAPCVIFMVGARGPTIEEWQVVYPASELAAAHGASAATETSDPRQAYAGFAPALSQRPPFWRLLPWA